LAYSLAQYILEIKSPLRKIVIDGSLYGMGRVPGNLGIEKIMDHCNVTYGKQYILDSAYDAIDDYILPIYNKTPWGYMIPYAISAQNDLHRTYAEYLIGKWKLKTSDINAILSEVSHEEAEQFNELYIENLYRQYLDVPVSDDGIKKLACEINGKQILILAPGKSISDYQETIKLVASKENLVCIAINFIPNFIKPEMVFFSTIKRYETEILNMDRKYTKIIVSSNLLRNEIEADFIIGYEQITNHDGLYSEDSVLMMISILKRIGFTYINIAGFDGFSTERANYFSDKLERNAEGREILVDQINNILSSCYKNININFITPTKYNGMRTIGEFKR
jgi:4-hydroxy 2-oxovalerate aldolase